MKKILSLAVLALSFTASVQATEIIDQNLPENQEGYGSILVDNYSPAKEKYNFTVDGYAEIMDNVSQAANSDATNQKVILSKAKKKKDAKSAAKQETSKSN